VDGAGLVLSLVAALGVYAILVAVLIYVGA